LFSDFNKLDDGGGGGDDDDDEAEDPLVGYIPSSLDS
jgi:hypothetical protein